MPDLSKLPKWAQEEIKRLESSVEYWRKKAHGTMSPNADRTNTFVREYLNNERLGLPPDSHVCFKLGMRDDEIIECYVRDDGGGEKRLHVMTERAIIVRPSTSNVVEIIAARSY